VKGVYRPLFVLYAGTKFDSCRRCCLLRFLLLLLKTDLLWRLGSCAPDSLAPSAPSMNRPPCQTRSALNLVIVRVEDRSVCART